MSNWEYFQQYPAIALVVYVLAPLCGVWYAVHFAFALYRSREQSSEPMRWEECKVYADKIRKQYPDKPEDQPEQFSEAPYIELKSEYSDQKQVIEWGAWDEKSVLKS